MESQLESTQPHPAGFARHTGQDRAVTKAKSPAASNSTITKPFSRMLRAIGCLSLPRSRRTRNICRNEPDYHSSVYFWESQDSNRISDKEKLGGSEPARNILTANVRNRFFMK